MRCQMEHNSTKYKIKFFLIFAAPTVVIFITVMLIPFLYGFVMSFTDTNGIASTYQWIGLNNYITEFMTKHFGTL